MNKFDVGVHLIFHYTVNPFEYMNREEMRAQHCIAIPDKIVKWRRIHKSIMAAILVYVTCPTRKGKL